MKINIVHCDSDKQFVANSKDDCELDCEKSAYEFCLMRKGRPCCVGKIIAYSKDVVENNKCLFFESFYKGENNGKR